MQYLKRRNSFEVLIRAHFLGCGQGRSRRTVKTTMVSRSDRVSSKWILHVWLAAPEKEAKMVNRCARR